MTKIQDIYELSPMQQGILFHTLYDRTSSAYFGQLSCTIHSEIDVDAFQKAWQWVTDRHAILRTSFHWLELDKPKQVVHSQTTFPWQYLDWSALSRTEQKSSFDALLETDRAQGFDLEAPPLSRATLIKLASARYRFIWSHHHLLLDGWSVSLVLKEVLTYYEAGNAGVTPTAVLQAQFRDYIIWLQQRDVAADEAYWRQLLHGWDSPTRLKVHGSLPEYGINGDAFAELTLHMTADTTKALSAFVRRHHITMSTLLQAGWAILLSKYTDADEVLFGTVISGRPHEIRAIESMVGLFVNTLPTPIHVDRQAQVVSWLQNLHARQKERENHGYNAVVDIQGWTDIPRDTPLFESIFVYQNFPLENVLADLTGSLSIADVQDYTWSNYPLALVATPGPSLNITLAGRIPKFTVNKNRMQN